MFEPVLHPEPRGFSGRPLVALIVAVGAGSLAAYARIPTLLAGGLLGLAGYLWHRAEKPK